jgi:multisubunit Na+/H+ antiporter MnhG subunit
MVNNAPSASVDSLGVIIPSVKGRKVAYALYAVASLVITNCAVAISAIGASNPAWLTIALAVVGNLAAPFGAIAIANAPRASK